MRLLVGLSAAAFISCLGSAAFAAAAPTSVLDVDASAASAKVAPSADAAMLESAARVVLAERVATSKALTFGPSRAISLLDGRRIVKLPQTHAGLPVLLRSATVSFGADGVANVVAAKLSNDLPSDVTPSIDTATAAYAASKISGVEVDPARGRLVIWPSGDGDRLAWRFYTPSMGLPYAPVTLVDAKSGQVIAHYNAAVRMHQQATVYPTNPVKSPQTKNVTLPLVDGGATLSSELVVAHNCIDMKTTKTLNIPGVPFPITLHVCELKQTSIADGSGNFVDQPADDKAAEDPFAELHIFYHTHHAYDYFRQFDPTFKVQAGALDAVANLRLPQGLDTFDLTTAGNPNLPLVPFQNAFFSPPDQGGLGLNTIFGITGGAMMFGQGPLKDYSYDADVIYHEFTHAVVNATIQLVGTAHRDAYGLTVSPGAMNEGLSDYFAAAISGDPDVGEYAILDYDPSGAAIRSLAGADACPTNIAGQVHNDSTLFAASLWDVRTNLPNNLKQDLDLAVFSAMNAAPSGDLGFEDMAKLIIAEVTKAQSLGTTVASQIDSAFTKRGVLPECTRILDYKGDVMTGPLKVPTQAGGSLGVWFGLSMTSANLGTNKLGYAPGTIQVRVPLPDNTTELTVDFEAMTQGSGGGIGGSTGSFTPKILALFGEQPITFTYSPFAVAEGTVAVDATGTAGQTLAPYTATVQVPAGAKTAYVMIANAGEADGIFTNLAFTTVQSAGAGGGGQGGSGGSSGEGGNSVNPVNEDGSCGCSVPGSSNAPFGATIASIAALVGMLGRRRRRN